MKTRMKTIEVEEQYWELTRADLQTLRGAMRGGNADQDNVQLLRYVADLLPEGKHDEIRRALKERSTILQNGIHSIDGLLEQR